MLRTDIGQLRQPEVSISLFRSDAARSNLLFNRSELGQQILGCVEWV